jgi:hypothetical protein
LRVPKENIDVSTLAMMGLQRHRRATAERPMIDDLLLGINLFDRRASHSK